MPTPDKNSKQHMDVAPPGKMLADASARPVIVGHKPLVQDPMVSNPSGESTNPEVETPKLTPSVSKKVITPLDDSSEVPKQQAGSTEEPVASPEDSETASPEDRTGEVSSEAAVVDAVAEQVGTKKKKDNETEEERKRQEELDKLIADKKYFVPISRARRKQKRRMLISAAAFLVIIAASFLMAADAGLIKGFQAPFDILQDSSGDAADAEPMVVAPNALKKIAVPAASSQKTYTDTAKIFSLEYPDSWAVQQRTEGTEGPRPDFTKVSAGVDFIYPNAPENTGVSVQADSTGTLQESVVDNWAANKHTPKQLTINGYPAQYVQIVFNGDAERYTDDNYLISNGTDVVFITFRQKYYHASPPANWDATAALPAVNALVNSIKFL